MKYDTTAAQKTKQKIKTNPMRIEMFDAVEPRALTHGTRLLALANRDFKTNITKITTYDHEVIAINNDEHLDNDHVGFSRAMKPTQGVRFVGFLPQNRMGESPTRDSSLANKRYTMS